jgi:hypothetical protein
MARMTKLGDVFVGPARVGRGLFAGRAFRRCETVLVIRGRLVHYSLLWKREGSAFSANCIRFGPESYLDPGDGPARYLNHSCAPNTAVTKRSNRLCLVATRRISKGEEIVFDYSTTIGDDDVWRMRCKCGDASCRGLIRNFGSLPIERRGYYLENGFVPAFIVRTLTDRASRRPRKVTCD